MNILKHYKVTIITTALLLLLSACGGINESTGPDIPWGWDLPISFDCASETRAMVNQTSDLQASPFVVVAHVGQTSPNYSLTNKTKEFDHEPVSYNSTNRTWEYTNVKNWKNGCYHFMAYWPERSGVTLSEESGSASNIKVNLQNFTEQDGKTDLLFADAKIAEPKTVNMSFKHILGRIGIKAKKEEGSTSTIKITSFRITGINDKGDFSASVTNAPNDNTVFTNGAWANHSEPTSYESPAINREVTEQEEFMGEYIIMIPQTMAAGSTTITVNYTIQAAGDAVPTSIRKDFILNAAAPLNIAETINFKLTIKEDTEIIFGTPTVEPWGSSSSIGSGTITITQ